MYCPFFNATKIYVKTTEDVLKEQRMIRTSIFIFLISIATTVVGQKQRTVFDDVQFKIEPAFIINSVASDISPVFVGDSIYFTSVSEKYFNNTRREKRKTDFYNIYSASTNDQGIISSSRKLVPGFGNDYHEGPADYCEATGELFVTVNNYSNFEKVQKMVPVENIRLKLIIKKQINGKWQTVEELPFNDKKYHFAQPAISVTGDTLVFSSDYNIVNYGETDLFMSIRKNGIWSSPVNLGNTINTSGNELFPTFITGNILSFASNGQINNIGGLDIYYSNFPSLSKVEILGSIINSPYDDFGLVIHKNKNVGYFSSNRNTNYNDDIFKLDIQRLYKNFKGRVLDSDTNTPIANAEILQTMCNGDTIDIINSDSTGNFSFEIMNDDCIQVEVLKEGYENKVMNISRFNNFDFRIKLIQFYEILTLDAENYNPIDSVSISFKNEINLITNSQGLISLLPPLPDSCEFTIQENGYIIQTITPKVIGRSAITRDTVLLFPKDLKTVFFVGNIIADSSELQILLKSTPIFDQIIKILQLNPDLKVELGWHTDSRGSNTENTRLSRNRGAFAVRYLENNGIEKNRVIVEGYGESQLINNCKDGVECSEEEHGENRRIELKIIGFVKPQKVKPEEEEFKNSKSDTEN